MSITFTGKVAVVTGAGHGLGKSYALFLASRGARLVVNDFGGSENGAGKSQEPAKRVAEFIRDKGGVAVPNFDSIAEPLGAQRIVDDAIKQFGTVDILINNAGILRDKTFLNMPQEDFDEVLKVHLMGSVYVTRAALPIMKAKAYGRIVMTTSIAGLFGNFGQTNYSTAKMGIVGFMNALRLEVEKYNIFINTVAPLAVTRLAKGSGIFPQEIGSLLRPGLVCPLVVYLCSDLCRTSGDIICAGGGYFARAQILQGPGVRFDPKDEITPEVIAENYESIMNMEGAISFLDARESLQVALRPFLEHAP